MVPHPETLITIYILKKKLIITPVLGIPGGWWWLGGRQPGIGSSVPVLTESMSPQQQPEFLPSPGVPEGRSLAGEASSQVHFPTAHRGSCTSMGGGWPLPLPVAEPGAGHTVRSEEQNRTLSHSFCPNNNLSFLPSWAGCLVMNVDWEDNKELGH